MFTAQYELNLSTFFSFIFVFSRLINVNWRLINADEYVINTHRTCHLYIMQIYNTTCENGTIHTNMYRIIVQIIQSCVMCL